MIFAAGFGTRMGELTRETPKPMLPLAGRPMIDHAIGLLREAGVDRIVANTHYLSDRIAPHLVAQGVTVLREEPILETGGGLRAALPALGDGPVITFNPDAAWKGPNPVRMLREAWSDDMRALLVLIPLVRAQATASTGDFSLENGEIHRKGPWVYSGLQMLRTDRMGEIGADVFSLNAYWDLLAASGPIHGIAYPGTWCDIGHPEGLTQAERLLG
jgi:MurNAc alpha-1-phosphate uridylyltransferase